MKIPELRTERLLMRGWRDSDLDAWAEICADPETMRWVGSEEPVTRAEGWPGIEVGWLAARPRWGLGYATEAARSALSWAREELGAPHLISLIADDNPRSERVAKKLGMVVEGRFLVHGKHDVRVFGRDL